MPTEEKNIETAIKSEEEFHEKLEAAKERTHTTDHSERFEALGASLHEKLHAQDSESALVLITKGSLGFGSSDIHYDTGES